MAADICVVTNGHCERVNVCNVQCASMHARTHPSNIPACLGQKAVKGRVHPEPAVSPNWSTQEEIHTDTNSTQKGPSLYWADPLCHSDHTHVNMKTHWWSIFLQFSNWPHFQNSNSNSKASKQGKRTSGHTNLFHLPDWAETAYLIHLLKRYELFLLLNVPNCCYQVCAKKNM